MNTSENDHTEPQQSPADQAETPEPADQDVAADAHEPQDDLPEWEPLTPELAEDEAIRGDFMLRWAVILLTLLLACTSIGETGTLVHIKTGQYLAANNWLPPTNDIFSYTGTDRPWTNLSWFFDLILAGVFTLLGASGLTIFKALLAAVVFYLIVSITKPDVSTWCGAILAALALLACHSQFTAQPEIVTLLGLSLTMWFLHQWKERGSSKSLWALVPMFLLWSNLDPRMFLGLALILLYTLGETIGSFIGRPGLADAAHRKQLWIVVAICFVAALINPFVISSLTAPITLYSVEYPNLRTYHPITTEIGRAAQLERLQYFPMFYEDYRTFVGHNGIAGLLLLVATAITFVLNRSKLDIGHVAVFVGFVGLASSGSHELAAAALVCCVLANLNGQEWYVASFRQTYSVDSGDMLFSRGGRALTVVALFAVAFMAISGRLAGADGNRIGFGLTDGLQSSLDGLREDLKDSFDDRPFHFRLEQGDQLIWLDQKVFVDSRVALYADAAAGLPNLIELHNRTRRSLRTEAPDATRGSDAADNADADNILDATKTAEAATKTDKTQESEFKTKAGNWKETFDRYHVTHVLPRMSGSFPDYRTFLDLMASEEWELTHLGSATAIFFRTDTSDPALKEYVESHKTDFVKDAFVTNVGVEKSLPVRDDWPQPRSGYKKFFSILSEPVSNPVQQARHYRSYLLGAGARAEPKMRVALAYLAIRKANQGLAESHENVVAFRILGDMYRFLGVTEVEFVRPLDENYRMDLRHYQAMHAYNQALILEPDDPATHLALFKLYIAARKQDLGLREVARYLELTEYKTDLTEPERNVRRELVPIMQQLTSAVDGISKANENALQQQPNENPEAQPMVRLQLAQQSFQYGFVLQALQILEDDRVFLEQNPVAQQLYALCLMQAGRAEEASIVFTRFEEQSGGLALLDWRFPAGISKLAYGQYEQAIPLWNQHTQISEAKLVTDLMQSLPLCESTAVLFGQGQDIWPAQQAMSALTTFSTFGDGIENVLLSIGLCHLEAGRSEYATKEFQKILERNPETKLRPLLSFYLLQVSQELVDAEPPSAWIPVWSEMFERSADTADDSGSSEK